jgi:TPR repeat protein
MSLHSSPNSQRILQPRHATTLPPPTAHAHAYTSPRYDGRPPSNGFEDQQGHHTGMLSYNDSNNLGRQPPFVQQSGFNPLYAAASDVLGMGPPPNSRIPLVPAFASIGSNSSVDTAFANGQAPLTMVSNASGHPSLPDSYSLSVATHFPDAHELEPRPQLERAGTSASVNLTTYKSKAIDLSAPPYTKEYIDQYRHRIKADPDPEAHFLYAKYLIDAAKKIRASAKDQRTAKKYSELLIGESLKVIRRLATQGEAYDEAQFFLANCYGTGALGLQVDHERAYHLYLQAAKQNHAAASYRVAVCNEIGAGTRREPPRAAAFYRKAASLGDTPAMYKLGMILLQGLLGESKNQREAINWLKRAAEQADEENPHALHELALLHEQPAGTLVTYDPGYAKNLYTQAGQLGYTPSQYKLGQCYEYGSLTCPVDARRSIAWYTKAAEKGDAEAELALSGWYLTGSEGVLKQSDSEAYLWARRAANKGLSKAEYAVGYYAEVGIGIKQDIEFAKRWYMRAAGMLHSKLIEY